jgi:hypothetical protein
MIGWHSRQAVRSFKRKLFHQLDDHRAHLSFQFD